jgi:outer membrane protein TolC
MHQVRRKTHLPPFAVLTACLVAGLSASSNAMAESGLSLAEAVKTTLELSPTRFIQQANVTSAKAGVTINEGAFNFTPSAGLSVGQNSVPLASVPYNAMANGPFAIPKMADVWDQNGNPIKVPTGAYGPGADARYHYQNTDTATIHAEISKYFQSGISASIGMSDTRIVQKNLSTVSRPNLNNAQINLSINVPLLKNAGEVSAAGRLNAAKKQQEAAVEDYKFFLTALANNAIAAYWDYRLAIDSLAIREISRDRVMRITNEVNQFVSSPDPKKDAQLKKQMAQIIYTAEGARVNKNRMVIDYQQYMEQAKTSFALTLGVPPEQFNTLAKPSDPIPDAIIPASFDANSYRAAWRKAAISNRLDLQASKLRQQASDFIVKKAQRDLYPQVDLNASVGYQGLQEGNKVDNMWNSFGDNVNDPNWAAGVEFRYPIGNQVAEGTLDSAKAQYKQAELSVYQKTREIDAGVDINVGYVERYVHAISKAEQAAKEYKEALAAWKQTPLNDPSAILGMLQTEGQYTEALLTVLNIRTEYAKLVADTRFKTGLLGKTGATPEDYAISFNEVSQLPK